MVEPFAANLIVESSAGKSHEIAALLARHFATSLFADDIRSAAGSGPRGFHLNLAPRHIETFLAAAGSCAEVMIILASLLFRILI